MLTPDQDQRLLSEARLISIAAEHLDAAVNEQLRPRAHVHRGQLLGHIAAQAESIQSLTERIAAQAQPSEKFDDPRAVMEGVQARIKEQQRLINELIEALAMAAMSELRPEPRTNDAE